MLPHYGGVLHLVLEWGVTEPILAQRLMFSLTVSERLARDTGDKSMAITPLMWAKKGLPVMLLTLVICTIVMYLFFPYYSQPI